MKDNTHPQVLRKKTLLKLEIFIRRPLQALFFFNCYLAPPRPISGHYREDSPTHPMLINTF